MTDSALSGPPTPKPGTEASTEPGNLPQWVTFAERHDWRRAQAAASLAHAEPALLGMVTAIAAFQEDVRGKNYPAARRALAAYTRQLSEVQATAPADAALLERLAPPQRLAAGLDALDSGSKLADAAEMEAALAPAAAHPLTQAEAGNALGVLHALQGQAQQATGQFETALAADPGHYRARMNLGNLALEAGDPAAAEAHYRAVLQLAPDYDGAHHNLGVALRRQGKLSESVRAIRKGQRLGTARTRQQDKDALEEQLRVNPRLKQIRLAVYVVLALVILLVLLGGKH